MDGPSTYAAEFAHRAMRAERDAMDELCERMLVTPNSPGISVQTTIDFRSMEAKSETVAKLDPAVPFGEIQHLPDIVKS